MSKVYRHESRDSRSVSTLLTSLAAKVALTSPRRAVAEPNNGVTPGPKGPLPAAGSRVEDVVDGSPFVRETGLPSAPASTGVDRPAGRDLSNGASSLRVDRPLFDAAQIPVLDESLGYRAFKRLMDIIGATVGLVLLGPLMVLCAILIKVQDGGPVLFRQVRVGKRGERFEIVKFRSMVVNAEQMQSELDDLNEHDDHRTFKILNDPRITPVGRFMRRMSLDELPQLWNVLCGDMTLVGPRPALPREVAMYDPEHLVRLAVKPGLTCIWQVSGRSNLGFQRQIELDLEYIRRRSILLDLKLIAHTFPAVVLGDGAA